MGKEKEKKYYPVNLETMKDKAITGDDLKLRHSQAKDESDDLVLDLKKAKEALGQYYRDDFDYASPLLLQKLIAREKAEDFKIHNQKQIPLSQLKSAIFFGLMQNDPLIAALQPERREEESGFGVFKSKIPQWKIKDCALKEILNQGSGSGLQHKENKPTATLKKIYELFEQKYNNDKEFKAAVDSRFKFKPDFLKEGPGKKSRSSSESS